jgi:hypothetical protein
LSAADLIVAASSVLFVLVLFWVLFYEGGRCMGALITMGR